MPIIGWLIEWKEKCSSGRGIVFEEENGRIKIFNERSKEVYEIPSSTRVIKIRPAYEQLTGFRIEEGMSKWKSNGDDTRKVMGDIIKNLELKGENPLEKLSSFSKKKHKNKRFNISEREKSESVDSMSSPINSPLNRNDVEGTRAKGIYYHIIHKNIYLS